jgi:phosphoketolase
MSKACGGSSSNFRFQEASAATPETPGSIHEGGELGYSVSHAFGAAFDTPDLLVAVVIGDGEAETGPLMASLHSNKFLNPIRDGAVLPILHLNGYKIANPTISARISSDELHDMFASSVLSNVRMRHNGILVLICFIRFLSNLLFLNSTWPFTWPENC